MDLDAGFPEIRMLVVAFQSLQDRFCCCAFLRYIGQGDIYQGPFVAFHKGGALQSREENFTIHAFAFMIDNGILVGIASRQIRIAGSQAGPDFGADIAAAAVLISIIDQARKGRLQARPQVSLSCPVFHPVGNTIGKPVFSQNRSIYIPSITLHRGQPDNLQIQIIVGRRPHGQILRVEGNIVYLSLSFEGRPQHASDVFSCPAAHHLVFVGCKTQFHFFIPSLSKLLFIINVTVTPPSGLS